jgi:hypothetical protein
MLVSTTMNGTTSPFMVRPVQDYGFAVSLQGLSSDPRADCDRTILSARAVIISETAMATGRPGDRTADRR